MRFSAECDAMSKNLLHDIHKREDTQLCIISTGTHKTRNGRLIQNVARLSPGIKSYQTFARRVSDAMKPRSHGFFNRRYATDHLGNASCPALKDRAKLITTIRVGRFEVIATFEATPKHGRKFLCRFVVL